MGQRFFGTLERLHERATASISGEPPTGQSLSAAVTALVDEQLHQLMPQYPPSSVQKESAPIDFPAQFLLFQNSGIGAQVAEIVNQGVRWVSDLRVCCPPACDQYPSLTRDAHLRAESEQVLQKRHREKAKAVHTRDVARNMELKLALVAEEYLLEKGHNPTDLTRRRQLLQLQSEGFDFNGNWVVSSTEGSMSLLRNNPLYQATTARSVDKVVSKEATSQIDGIKTCIKPRKVAPNTRTKTVELAPSMSVGTESHQIWVLAGILKYQPTFPPTRMLRHHVSQECTLASPTTPFQP
jgi:hypothetical protein